MAAKRATKAKGAGKKKTKLARPGKKTTVTNPKTGKQSAAAGGGS